MAYLQRQSNLLYSPVLCTDVYIVDQDAEDTYLSNANSVRTSSKLAGFFTPSTGRQMMGERSLLRYRRLCNYTAKYVLSFAYDKQEIWNEQDAKERGVGKQV